MKGVHERMGGDGVVGLQRGWHLAGMVVSSVARDGDERLVKRLRAVVGDMLDAGRTPTLARLARRLGTSSRSLQRRLHQRKTSWSSVVDTIRLERTFVHLKTAALTNRDLARRAGFKSVPGFLRRFRVWTGTTPRRYRQQLQNGPARIEL